MVTVLFLAAGPTYHSFLPLVYHSFLPLVYAASLYMAIISLKRDTTLKLLAGGFQMGASPPWPLDSNPPG